MRSRPGDDFPSPVRETVIIHGCHGRVVGPCTDREVLYVTARILGAVRANSSTPRKRLSVRVWAEYVRTRPQLQGSSVQRAINDYLNALCGRPFY
jgi:hypothetical protein